MLRVGQLLSLISLMLLMRGSSGGGVTVALDDPTEIFSLPGESHVLNATVRDGGRSFDSHTLFEIYHRNTLTMQERRLARIEDYNATTAVVETGYSVSITEVDDTEKTISFTIDSLSFDDDGSIDFHLLSTTNANDTESRGITVVVIPDTVKLQFGDRNAVTTNSSSAIKVDSGNITVYCIVEESNPEITNISLTLNGNALTLASGPDSELISDDERKYTNNVSAIVEVTNNLAGTQTLACEAVDYFSGTHTLQLLYELNSAREGQTPFMGLIVLLVISLLWYTL